MADGTLELGTRAPGSKVPIADAVPVIEVDGSNAKRTITRWTHDPKIPAVNCVVDRVAVTRTVAVLYTGDALDRTGRLGPAVRCATGGDATA